MARYQVYPSDDGKVVVVSKYAGKAVRGIAKCSPEDSYNSNFGEELAKARCDKKVAAKRKARAAYLLAEALQQQEAAQARVAKMLQYQADADMEYKEVTAKVAELEHQAGVVQAN